MAKTARRQRGDGALYQRADGMWIGSIDLGWTADGARRRKTVSSRTQAGALAKLREVRRQVGVYGDVPTRSLTVHDWLTRWLRDIATPRVRPRTLDTYRHKVALIDDAIGRVRLDKLTPAHVRTMHQRILAKGLSSTTALQAHRIFAASLKDAEREGMIVRNVARLVDAPRKAVSDRGALTSAQAKAVLRGSARDPLAAQWGLALLYGVRQGEALGLTWDCIDADASTIDLAWQLQRLTWRHGCSQPVTCGRKRGAECPARHLGTPAGFEVRQLEGPLCLTRPKSAAGTRVVPLIDPMRGLLERQAQLSAGQLNPHGLVWHDDEGHPLDAKADRAAWYTALEAAKAPRIPLHGARHTTATLLLEMGVDAKVIGSILGHSDVVTTQGYQHVDLSLQRAALEGLGRAISAER